MYDESHLRIAVGGRFRVMPMCPRVGEHALATLDLPFEVDDEGGNAVRATKVGNDIDLFGVAEGSNTIAITGEWVGGGSIAHASTVTAITIEQDEDRAARGAWVWAPGRHAFRFDVGDELGYLLDLDTTATFVNGSTATSGFTIDVAMPGTYAIAAHAGTLDVDLPFTVSNTADKIALDDPTAQIKQDPVSTTQVCFGVFDAGRRIVGADWTFTATGATTSVSTELKPCVWVRPTVEVGQTVDITATAAGRSLTVSLPVI